MAPCYDFSGLKIEGVSGRRQAAEVDRVWEVNPGVFAPTVTFLLSYRWGVVTKRHVDDFMEVLRWSRDFGVDTEDGREIKNVVVVFAGAAFSTKENIQMRDGSMVSLAQYAARQQLQLVTATDFNDKMRERGVDRLTVQAICKVARDEAQVREALDALWKDPEGAGKIMAELRARNEDLYKFEEMLESGDERPNEMKDK